MLQINSTNNRQASPVSPYAGAFAGVVTPSSAVFSSPQLPTMAPNLDAFAGLFEPTSPDSQFRRWQAEPEAEPDAEEVRRRAREWVNRTVPMETIDDSPLD